MRKADNLTTILGHCHVIWYLNFLETSGHLRPVMGLIYLYMFRALCAHHHVVKTVLYSIWYLHTCRWSSGAQFERGLSTCAPDDHLQV